IAKASETANMRLVANLDSATAVGDSFSSSIQVFDSLGASHIATVRFTRAAGAPGAPPSFNFDVTVDGGEVTGGTAGVPFSRRTGAAAAAPPGTMDFDANGKLVSVDPGTGAISPPTDFPINVGGWSNGAAAQTLNFDLVDDQNNPNLTAFASPSATSSTFQ